MISRYGNRIIVASFSLLIACDVLFFSMPSLQAKSVDASIGSPIDQGTMLAKPTPNTGLKSAADAVAEVRLVPPIDNALRRITKKTFGLEVHPETSPVPNDRFNGLHAGVDFETLASEQNSDTVITAVCTGPLLLKKWATGYGGVAVQRCLLNGEDVSAIYGHIEEASVAFNAGDLIQAGERIGILGAAFSHDTDGARKHLHFGLRKGLTLDIRGYVKDESELSEFLDATKFMQF